MASSILLSDNGASSGSAGVKSTGGNDGVLLLQTTTSGGTATTAVTLDNNQNMGLGVTPSAWQSASRSLDMYGGGSLYSNNSSNDVRLSLNTYVNSGGSDTYKTTNFATIYKQISGQHIWQTAASGTAGNTITFTQAMTLDASGNLGINATAPKNPEGYNTTNFKFLTLQATSGAADRGAMLELVGTGGGSPSYWLGRIGFFSTGNTYAHASITSYTDGGGSNSGALIFGTTTAANSGGPTERARIDSSGNLLVGKTSQSLSARTESDAASAGGGGFATANTAGTPTGNAFYSNFTNGNNTGCLHFYGRAGGADRIYIYGNGNIQNSNNSYGAISDIKRKENVVDATPKLEQLQQVRVVNYNLIGDEQKQIGVIAQELEQIFPGMVEETPDRDEEGNDLGTTTKAVKYSVFVPMLIKAIQEQQAIITQLQADVAALKGTQP